MAVIGREVVEEINPENESKSVPFSCSSYILQLQWRNVIENIKKKSARSFSMIPWLTNNYEISTNNLWRKLLKFYWSEGGVVDVDRIRVLKPSWKTFSYSELAAATDDFSPGNLLGKGGNAEVYKGQLADGEVVAVKKITTNEKEEDRVSGFLLELGIIAHVNHPNATHLIGFGVDRGLYLVLQFAPHGSLASRLFGSDECLDWKSRYKVATGIAEGLKYLHHDCRRHFIHRDITASNILLTQRLCSLQITDFGLAKRLPENWSQHVVHPIEGTLGHLAPEYFIHGIVNEKTDVFAFGVLLLEILTGRRAVDSSGQSLVIWGKPLLEKNQAKELVDPRLEDNYDPTEVKRAMLTASLCIMKRVVELLKNEDSPVEWQQKGCGEELVVVDGSELQEYTRSSYLNELNRYMQLVLE